MKVSEQKLLTRSELYQFSLNNFILDQKAFSTKAFGPDNRYKGVCDHIRKELKEVEAVEGKDVYEWADIIILAIDGAWRAGFSPRQLISALTFKLARNKLRTWPDWRTQPKGKAIEHVRGNHD